jgi:exopolysaccharide biosynthesis polyprenyl glycosylphosphotransferase
LSEGVIAPDDQGGGGPTSVELAATLEVGSPLELDWPRRERWPHAELWARLALVGLLGFLMAGLITTQTQVGSVRVGGLTVILTGIWYFALRRSAQFARGRRIAPVVAALIGTAAGLGVVSLLNFWLLDLLISPGTLLAMAGLVFVVGGGFQAVAARGLNPRRPVIVVAADDGALDLIRELEEEKNAEYEIIGVVDDRSDGFRSNGVPLLGDTDRLVEILRHSRPEVVVCSRQAHTRTVDRLLDAGMTSVHVLDAQEFQEHAFHRVDSRSVSAAWFASVLDVHRQNYSARAKRAFDFTVASIALALTSPLLVVIPVLVRLSGRGPVLYRQTRIGEGGELFEILKFRTMIVDAEVGHAVWATENDPRVTPIGRILRKTRMDELPQLWNVVRGDMSIVGPRPERPEFLSVLGEHVPFWRRRDLLKPGITGWAQVHSDYTSDISGAATKLSYDLYYLKYRSLSLDILIVFKTLRVVLFGAGAR